MPRLRLGVALLLPTEVSAEINGLRRALGDGALDRIPPHITLVPPVNVRDDELSTAITVLRKAAAECPAFSVHLGPVTTFHPDTPVIKLEVSGPGLATVHALRDKIFVPPLERTLTWPFVPHVTLADGASLTRIRQAVPALDLYGVDVDVSAVHLLQEGAERRWVVLADAHLNEMVDLGRGSLPLQLHRSSLVDPVAARVLDLSPDETTLAFTACRDEQVLGVAAGYQLGDRMTLRWCRVAGEHQRQGIGTALMRQFLATCTDVGVVEVVLGPSFPDPCLFAQGFGFVNRRLVLPT